MKIGFPQKHEPKYFVVLLFISRSFSNFDNNETNNITAQVTSYYFRGWTPKPCVSCIKYNSFVSLLSCYIHDSKSFGLSKYKIISMSVTVLYVLTLRIEISSHVSNILIFFSSKTIYSFKYLYSWKLLNHIYNFDSTFLFTSSIKSSFF